ncbi:MAG TPA: DHHW family protein, partial [Anaerolineales bacterium]|nr:DHHW family protein [Anaerolineales bacterium]
GLIGNFNDFKYMIGDRVFQFAVAGKDGWFFFADEVSIQDYQRTSRMKADSLKRLLQLMVQLQEKTNQNGGIFLLIIPPDKSTVYSQYMPAEISVIGQDSNLDRFIAYAKKNSNLQVLDLRAALIRASQTVQVYYKTDTHWNCFGAYFAYEEILSRLAEAGLQPQAHSLESYEFVTQDTVMDLPTLGGLNIHEDKMDAIPKFVVNISNAPLLNKENPQPSLQVVVNSEKGLPNLMILHDSFYNACLHKFIEPSFSRVVSMPYRNAQMEDYLGIIETEKPNVVIVEILERFMDYFLEHAK